MKRLMILLTCLFATVALARETRMLDYEHSATGIKKVVLDAGVGDVEIMGDSGDKISAQVELKSKSSGWWSRHGTDISEVKIEGEVSGDTLKLRIYPRNRHHNSLSEDWTIHLPARLLLDIDLGVGEITITDCIRDINIDLGVGSVNIEGDDGEFGDISAECGVGDASVRTPKGRNEGHGFISHSVHQTGPGNAEIRVDVGVGDVTIRLQ
jgi:hypothetical protein